MLYILKGKTCKKGIELALLEPGVSVVLIEDGVLLDVTSLIGKVMLYALESDVLKRGVSVKLEGVELVDYAGLVDLIEEDKVATF